jgi:hypothetical protein
MDAHSLSILKVPLSDKIAEALMFDVAFASNFKIGTLRRLTELKRKVVAKNPRSLAARKALRERVLPGGVGAGLCPIATLQQNRVEPILSVLLV